MADNWKIYLVTLDGTPILAGTHVFNASAFHQYLADSADLGGFWNYIPFVYCVKSRLQIVDLRMKLSSFIAPRSFMVLDITHSARDGWLPGPAWDWFNQPAVSRTEMPLGLLGYKPST